MAPLANAQAGCVGAHACTPPGWRRVAPSCWAASPRPGGSSHRQVHNSRAGRSPVSPSPVARVGQRPDPSTLTVITAFWSWL